MEGQGNFFGVSETSTIDEAMASFLLGDSTASATGDPSKIEKLEEDPNKKKKPQPQNKNEEEEREEVLDELPSVELTEDDIFNTPPKSTEKPDPSKASAQSGATEGSKSTGDESINYSSLVNSLVSLGVLNELDEGEQIESDEQFASKFQKDAINRANQEIYNILTERHGEKALEAFKAIYVNGMTPEDYFGRQIEISSVRDLDMTDESNQERVLAKYFKSQGLNEDKVQSKIERLRNLGELESESTDAHEIIVRQEEEKFQADLVRKEQEEQSILIQKRDYFNNLQTILADKLKAREFDGIPVTDKSARETIDYLYTEKWKLPNGEKLTDFDKDILELKNPKNHELKVKLALLLRNKLDLSKIKPTSTVSTQTKKLFQDLVIKDKTIQRTTSKPSSSFFDI